MSRRSHRNSREIPPHLALAAIAAAASSGHSACSGAHSGGSSSSSPGSCSPVIGGRKDAPWAVSGPTAPSTRPGIINSGVRRTSRDYTAAAIEGSSAGSGVTPSGRLRRLSRETGGDATGASTVLPPLPRVRRTTH